MLYFLPSETLISTNTVFKPKEVKIFSIISSGGHTVQQSGTVCAIFLEGIIENFCMILLNLGQLN